MLPGRLGNLRIPSLAAAAFAATDLTVKSPRQTGGKLEQNC
jgi:hypothetical protein